MRNPPSGPPVTLTAMFHPVDPSLDLVALEERDARRVGRDDDVFGESPPPPARAPRNGCSTRVRPPPTADPGSTTCGPACSRTSTPGSTRCGASTWPARAAGTATACRSRSRSRRSSASPPSTRSRTTASSASTPSAARRCSATSRTGSRSPRRIGMWLDTAGAYWTLSNEYIESVWWLFHQMWDTGAIYEGYKVVPYCGRCGTALSSHELGQPGAYRDVTEPSVYVRFPLDRPRRRPPRVDDHPVDAALERRRRGRPGHRLRARARARRAGAISSWRAPGSPTCSAPTRRSSAPVAAADARRRALRAAVHAARGRRRRRVHGRRRRLRHRRRRLGHRAPRARVRRDRPRGRRARRAAHRQPGQRRGALRRRRGRAVRGPVRQGRRPRPHRRPHRARASSCRRRLHALVPALLALRHAAHLLGQARHGSRAPRRTRPRCSRENENDQLASRAHQARPLRRLAREQRRLGALPRPLLGHADPGLALPRLRPRHVRRIGRRARRSSRAATSPAWTCTGPTSTTSRIALHRRAGRGTAYRIEPVLDAWFDSGLDADRAVPLPVRERRRVRRRASPPTSSARRSTRRAAGSTRCSR